MRVIALVAGLWLLGATGLAKAGPLTLVETATLGSTAIGTGGFTTALSVDKFNVTDATLTGISVRLQGSVGGTIRIARGFNQPIAQAVSFTARLGSDFSLTVAPGNVVSLSNVVSNDYTVSLFIFGTGTSGQLSGTSATTASIAPALFSMFQGAGSVSLALNILRDNFTNDTGNRATETYNNTAAAEVEVTYTYLLESDPPTPVPAPMSAGFLGLGLAGLIALRGGAPRGGAGRLGRDLPSPEAADEL